MRRPALAALCGLLAGCAGPSLEGANVLLVVVDALRADHLGCYGYTERPTSPFIDGLAARSVVFDAAVSTASHTVPATLSLLTGIYPHRHGNQWFSETRSFRRPEAMVRPEVPGGIELAGELFARAGYRTGAVVANPWLRPEYGFGRGFETFRHQRRRWRRASEVNREARALLDRWGDAPFFLYVHYMDVHAPYEPPDRYGRAFAPPQGRVVYRRQRLDEVSETDLEYTRAAYDAEIRTLDDHLADLVEALAERDLARRTLIVFTSDHGDEFHEHGGLSHGFTLFEEVVRVPLFFFHPELEARARRVRAPVSAVDVLPTIAELVGVASGRDLDGISLAAWVLGSGEPPAERLLVSEHGNLKAVRRGSEKWIRSADEEGDRGFDLARDPGERHPVEGAAPPAIRERLAALPLGASDLTAQPVEASADEALLEEELRALGYVQ